MAKYTVKAGECIASVAAKFASTVEALWDAPDNQPLRQLRKDPCVLQEGDEVHVPDVRDKKVSVSPGGRHVFEQRNTRCDFEVTLRLNGQLRTGVAWVLEVGSETLEGTTGDDGTVRASVRADATTGVLRLPVSNDEFPIAFGDLDPLDSPRGIQSRLRSLAYYRHRVDGDAGPWTTRALRAFQADERLSMSGKPDAATLERLRERYGR
jgi:hypothetical protein